MRPASIALFEKLVYLSIALSAVAIVLGWDALGRMAQAQPGMSASLAQGVLIGAVIFGFAIPLLLVWFIARRASTVAKWIFVVLTAFSVYSFVAGLANPDLPKNLLFVFNAVTTALSVYAAWLLFRPDAKAWFDGSASTVNPVDPDPLD